MIRISLALLVGLAIAPGCAKKDDKPKAPAAATLTTGSVDAAGVRTIAIEAGKDGYVPANIPGKPGEKLKLVFTRTADNECISELKGPDGTLRPLPLGKPVEIAVTVPAEGEVKFACGMDMYTGVIVAKKG